MFEEMTEKFEPLKGKERVVLIRYLPYGVFYVNDVKSAVQGILEVLEKKKKKLKEDLSVLKGFMSFRQRRDFILILEWIDWFEQEIKKWFADVVEDEK